MYCSNDGKDQPLSTGTVDYKNLYADRAVPYHTWADYLAWAKGANLPNASALASSIETATKAWSAGAEE